MPKRKTSQIFLVLIVRVRWCEECYPYNVTHDERVVGDSPLQASEGRGKLSLVLLILVSHGAAKNTARQLLWL